MHPRTVQPRSLAAMTAVAAVSILMVAGCASSKSAAGGSVKTGAGASSASSASSTPSTSTTPTTPTPPTTPSVTNTSSTGPADQPPACTEVDAKIVPLRGAASGTTFSDLVVTNRGTTACTLPGQPKLQYLGANRRPVPVRFSSDPGLPSYRLLPGASAAMAVAYGTDGNPPCDVKIAYVRVTPPGADLPVDGKTHCANDGTYEENWVAGTYAAPH